MTDKYKIHTLSCINTLMLFFWSVYHRKIGKYFASIVIWLWFEIQTDYRSTSKLFKEETWDAIKTNIFQTAELDFTQAFDRRV